MNESSVAFDEFGLVPVVVQDDATDDVLMMAFMNAEALEATRRTGKMHYWSRSRQALWMKGETSGNEQIVRSIHVNCYTNSLLIKVSQTGVCCHTGFPTCFYRELTGDDQLVVHGEALFDPDEVYASAESLRNDLVRWIGAYFALAEHDLTDVSGTSRLLHESRVDYLESRIIDELRELAGVLTGEHRHSTLGDDAILEASQILYWTVLAGIRMGSSERELVQWLESGMLAGTGEPSAHLADRIRALAGSWANADLDRTKLIRETGGIVGAAATATGTSAHRVVQFDLDELRTRPYLSAYFAPSH
jgi:phosphoribosyl-AMP cyclohydrolase